MELHWLARLSCRFRQPLFPLGLSFPTKGCLDDLKGLLKFSVSQSITHGSPASESLVENTDSCVPSQNYFIRLPWEGRDRASDAKGALQVFLISPQVG